eukprot:5947607-Prymnesium_polylepis.2
MPISPQRGTARRRRAHSSTIGEWEAASTCRGPPDRCTISNRGQARCWAGPHSIRDERERDTVPFCVRVVPSF